MFEFNSIADHHHPFEGSKPKRIRTFSTEHSSYLPFNSIISIDVEKIYLHNPNGDSLNPQSVSSDEADQVSKRNPLLELPNLPSENFDSKESSLLINEPEPVNTYSLLESNGKKGDNTPSTTNGSQSDLSNSSKENKGDKQNNSESNGKLFERSTIKSYHSFSGKFGSASTKDLTISINPVKISDEKCLNFRYSMDKGKILRKLEKEGRSHNLMQSHNSPGDSLCKGLPTEVYVPKKSEEVVYYKSTIDPDISVKKSKLNGWSWHGASIQTRSYEYKSVKRTRFYYIGIRRKNSVIYVRDIVIIRPPREGIERPYVAKVASFWADRLEVETSDTQHHKGTLIKDHSSMMMTVYWYYRPENIEALTPSHSSSDKEVFFSRHYDDNSIACIIDQAFVLSYHSYCRFCAMKRFYDEVSESYQSLTPRRVVPALSTKDNNFPPENTDLSLVFFCVSGYSFNTGKLCTSH